MKKVSISIDGKSITTTEWKNILQVALENDIYIPHFCYHEDQDIKWNCRICLVEDEKTKKIVPSCTIKAENGLCVLTNSKTIKSLRLTNLELLLSNHKENCPHCKKNLYCKTWDLMKKYKISWDKYPKKKLSSKLIKLDHAIELDQNMCINCRNCEEICEKIWINYLCSEWKWYEAKMWITKDENINCITCGQCTTVCPVGAIREQCQIEQVEKVLKSKNKILIAQCAPSVRVSIWDEFWFEHGTNIEWKIFTALRTLWFDKIFDVNMWADITTIVEAEELVERLKDDKNLPMFTSCCPAWVKYVEHFHPEIIPNLTTARSPHIHSGWAYKTWWAEKEKINPKNIIVVSIMPCTAKKQEMSLEKFNINWVKPVDYVLTAREFNLLLKKNNIDLKKLKDSKLDLQWNYSWAWAIYWASWGVMESALRTAYKYLTWENLKNFNLKEVRWIEWIKKADIKIWKKIVKVWIVSTPKNAKELINIIKKDPKAFDYIEVMACPWWCIWGWWQPIPTTNEIIIKRKDSLYNMDNKTNLRTAHDNPVIQDFEQYLAKCDKSLKHSILHTSFINRKK